MRRVREDMADTRRRRSLAGVALAAAMPLAFGSLADAQTPAGAPTQSGGPRVLQLPPAETSPEAQDVAPRLGPAQAAVAFAVLRDADQHGLQPKAYLPQGVTDPAALSASQLDQLTEGLLRYARDVRNGRLAPEDFPKLWQVRPEPWNPRPELVEALAEDRLQAWLDGLPPRYSGYLGLKRGLARYRELAAAGGWPTVPEGSKLELGVTDPRVAVLRARLAVEDPEVPVGGATFDEGLQAAVQRAQRRAGLEPDGVVGPATLRMLNEPVGQRILQIIANMERWRWLPPTMPATRVQVNSGAAIVSLFQDDRPVMSMKAVSGKKGDETPMLVSEIHSVVINPPWNVPTRIANEELWPKERANPGYLASHGYRVIPLDGGQSRLQQASGDTSALGRFKFDFDNPFAVYLHDTPAKAGFDRYARQASHGCVRIEKPRRLAEALLAGDPVWTPEAIDTQLQGDKTVRARLPQKVPVYILYWTAFAGADGQMHFRADPYGWDRELLQRTGVLTSAPKA